MEDRPEKPNIFSTKDLNLAAFIWCQAHTVLAKLEATRGKGNTIFFVFEHQMSPAELHNLQIAYANEETLVEPTAFCKKQSQLRDLLHTSLSSKRD